MKNEDKRYIVKESALPKGLRQVALARSLLLSGKAQTINEAVQQVGISRSAYYKYRDGIELFSDSYNSKIITFQAVLSHRAGVLGALLGSLAKSGVNILTVNQNIPVNGQAGIIISMQTSALKGSVEALTRKILGLDGVVSAGVLLQDDT